MNLRLALIGAIVLLVPAFARAADPPTVTIHRLPAGAVQPQAMVDGTGTVHLIYLQGDPAKSDIFYCRSTDAGPSFSAPVRVNSQPGSAVALGTVRGAHLALGRGGRVHVAWMGSSIAEPRADGKTSPMLYARSAEDGSSFEPQRNLIRSKPGLDGGGSVAADNAGHVYVAWHAPAEKGDNEQSRHVWLVRSDDDGANFSTDERSISPDTGTCGCCGMRLFAAPGGSLFALYRTTDAGVHRDMTLLRLDPASNAPQVDTVGAMRIGTCVMSTAAFAAAGNGSVVAAWERNRQIEWTPISGNASLAIRPLPGKAADRKHPAIATNAAGETLIAWTEGTGWNKGGSIAWQAFDVNRGPIPGSAGRQNDLPVWGAPAAFARPDGGFTVVY